jgi:hypothetical protein
MRPALIAASEQLVETDRIEVANYQPQGHVLGEPAVPLLAIPTVTTKSFACPEGHLAALRALLPAVTNVLSIGWRGQEKHFIKLLSEGKLQAPWLTVTRSGAADLEAVVSSAGIASSTRVVATTFSQMLSDWTLPGAAFI